MIVSLVVVLSTVGPVIAGCSSASSPTTTGSNQAASTQTTAAAGMTTSTTIAAVAKGKSLSWDYDLGSTGYEANLRVTIWDPIPTAALPTVSHPADSNFVLSSGSNYTPKTDCVVPVEMTITNKTADWDLQTPELGAIFPTGPSDGPKSSNPVATVNDFDWVLNYSTGPTTKQYVVSSVGGGPYYVRTDADTAWSWVRWSTPLAPDHSDSQAAFVVIHGYFSPANPGGDTSLLDAIVLDINGGGAKSYAITLSGVAHRSSF